MSEEKPKYNERGELLERRVVKRRTRVKKRQTEADVESAKNERLQSQFAYWWILILVGALVVGVGMAGWVWYRQREQRKQFAMRQERERLEEFTKSSEKMKWYREVNELCFPVLAEYLRANDSYGRVQSVVDGAKHLMEMVAYDEREMPVIVDGSKKVELSDVAKFDFGGKTWMRTAWKVGDDVVFEANFVMGKAETLLDWESFVRYQEVNWGLFLAGQTRQQEGRFFLYLKPYEDDQLAGSLDMGFQLCEPVFGKPSEFRLISPVMTVRRSSEAGKMLEAGLRGEGVPPMLEMMAPPKGMLRVQVVVRREKVKAGVAQLQLVKLEAVDWLSRVETSKPAEEGDREKSGGKEGEKSGVGLKAGE